MYCFYDLWFNSCSISVGVHGSDLQNCVEQFTVERYKIAQLSNIAIVLSPTFSD